MRILGEIQLSRKWKCWSSSQDLANKWGEYPHSPSQKSHKKLQWAQLGRTSPGQPPWAVPALQKPLATPVSVPETQSIEQLQPGVLGDAVGGSHPMNQCWFVAPLVSWAVGNCHHLDLRMKLRSLSAKGSSYSVPALDRF